MERAGPRGGGVRGPGVLRGWGSLLCCWWHRGAMGTQRGGPGQTYHL